MSEQVNEQKENIENNTNKETKEKKEKKPSQFVPTIKKLFHFCRPWYGWILAAFVFAMAASVVSLFAPRQVSNMVDYMVSSLFGAPDAHERVVSLGILLVILYGASFVLSYIQQLIMAWVTAKVQKKLRLKLSQKINKLPLSYLDKTPTGDTLSKITNDVDTVTRTLSWVAVTIISSVTLMLGATIFMFITNWLMALTAIVATIIAIVLIGLIGAKTQKFYTQQQKQLGELNGHIEEYFSGHTVMKTNNARSVASEKFDKHNTDLFTSAWKSQFYGGCLMPLMFFLSTFAFVAVCIVGGVLAFNGTISFGVIIAFMFYVDLFTRPLGDLGQVTMEMQSTVAAADRIFGLLHEKEMPDEINLEDASVSGDFNIKGDVEFKNVRFSYKPEKPVIKDFTANVKAGSKVAIVGPTGAGKTTLVNLLMKFYNVDSGDIKIDGTSINQIQRDRVASLFSMVLQDAWLFNGTIRQNLLYNMEIDRDREDELLEAATTAAGINHFIKTLPDGYETMLDEKADISDGQKQLLTIARAMIKNAPLLILDEATSSVDTRTEVLVKTAMDKLTKNRTSFIIAHRLSTIKNADLIIVMNKGDIVESGTHDSLLKSKGFYADLYNSQFSA